MARARLLIAGVRWPAETFIRRRLEALAGQFEVVVAATFVPPADAPRGVRLVQVPGWDASTAVRTWRLAGIVSRAALRSLPETVRFVRAARAESRNAGEALKWVYRLLPFVALRPDLLHFEWNFSAVRYLPLFDLFGCPVTVSCRGSQIHVAPHNDERNEAEKLPLTFAKAAAIHCVSDAIRDELPKHGLRDLAKARVIRPAIDHRFFSPAGDRQGAGGCLRIVTTGSLGWVKGPEYALLALRKLVDSGAEATLDMIGGGSKTDRQRVLYTIHDLELQSRVRLRGQVAPEDVREVLRNSDAFLLSSLSEGISNAALEAMACGLPVVTTACGGMREAVTDGVEGFVVAVRDSAGLAAALGKLARDPGLRERMGQAARARVEREFTLDAQTEAWAALYNSLLTEGCRANALDAHGQAAVSR